MTNAATAVRRGARYAGLDGIRAIAVTLVVVYHLFPRVGMHSGFVGVDVFFVLSGFLITSLLLREHGDTGRIALRPFWVRRARRLLPALAVLVLVCTAAAWAIGGDVLVGVGPQLVGAATFTSNWFAIAAGEDYFASTAPELYRNLWSLAVEEQFYLLLPLAALLIVGLRVRSARAGVLLGVAALSVAWAVFVAASTGDTSRVYYGTDTHAFGLLLGAGLAAVLQRSPSRPIAPPLTLAPPVALAPGWRVVSDPRASGSRFPGAARGRAGIRILAGVGLAALVATVVLAAVEQPQDAVGTVWLLVTVSALTAAVIAASIQPGSPLGRALDVAPLRWIGERSYGIYLWHWPVLVLLQAALPALHGNVLLGVVAAAITLAFAAASYRWVETPIRREGLRAVLVRFRRAWGSSSPRRLVPALTAVTGMLLVMATTAAVFSAPDETSAERAIQVGDAALRASPPADPSPSATPTPTPTPTPRGTPPVLEVEEVRGADVTAVGDSVMLAAAPKLLDGIPGIAVDAKVSRSMWAAPGILRSLEKRGELRRYVVVALGTNGPVDESVLRQIVRIIGADRSLILVTASAPRDWIDGVNRRLRDFARTHDNVVLARWDEAIAPHPEALAGDGIHPGSRGGVIFTRTVRAALDRAARERALAEHMDQMREYRQQVTSADDSQHPRRVPANAR